MTARLPSRMLVDALLRGAQAAGGFAVVIARGEGMGGGILVQLTHAGRYLGCVERRFDFDGRARLTFIGPVAGSESREVATYCDRRRSMDGDLWIIELDIVAAERFVAETMGVG